MAKDCPQTNKSSDTTNEDEDDKWGVDRDRIVESNEKNSDDG